jgi:catechol 2,3-dioxygenase-like lactoylglutathione lyase family enzyme
VIKGIKFASVPVSDQDRALEFYRDVLGFRVLTDQPFDETQRWIELQISGSPTALVLFTPDEHRDRIGSYSNVTFYADDVKRTYELLSSKGVRFLRAPESADWGTAAIFEDPDGNRFVLSSR